MNDSTQQALTKTLYRVLRPLIRLLIRHGVPYRQFADVARHVYVDSAEQDFALAGRKISHARTAVMTGINRKDIAKLKDRPHPLSANALESPSPTASIITGWINDPHFHAADGKPLALPIEDLDLKAPSLPTFTELVKRYCSDVPVRAILDELARIEAIEISANNRVHLIVEGYVPLQNMQESLRIFGTAAADLLGTMDHNIADAGEGRLIQRTVSYDDIPLELLPQIRQRGRKESEELLLQVNSWLAQCDRGENKLLVGSGKVRAGIGIYYFEKPADE
jgi:hypothetical protein